VSTLSVKDVCERYGVSVHTVLTWIESGELRAINVGVAPGKLKPRWRITAAALEAFELARTQAPAPSKSRRRKRAADVIEFYR
jgi:excisionase family DNA binding protein